MRSLSMLHRLRPIVVLSCLLTGCSMGMAQTGENNADEELLKRVSEQLVAVMAPVPGFVWPPVFKIVPDPEIQAHSTFSRGPKDDQVQPLVRVHSGLMTKVIQGDANRLALILGHELGHIALRHITSENVGQTPLVNLVIGRDQEIAADRVGMELALKAGFSRLRGLKAFRRLIDLGLDHAPIEPWIKGDEHPSCKERLAELDKDQAPLWKAMAAFHNG